MEHLWGPKPSAEEQALLSKAQALTAQVGTLSQQVNKGSGGGSSGGGSGKQGKRKCFKCGKVGHIASKCPEEKDSDGNKETDGKGDNGEKPSPSAPSAGSEWAKPKPGESEKKTTGGVERFCCSKCNGGKGFWNKTHAAADHKSEDALKAAGGGGAAGKVSEVDDDLLAAWLE